MNEISKSTELNTFRYCPKCGTSSFHKETSKSYICKSCNFCIFINTAAAVAGIIKNDDNEILMTIRRFDPAKGKLDLPGGFIEKDETAETALKREIHEELNIDICNVEYFTTYPNTYIYKNFTYNTLDIFYFCKAVNLQNIKADDDICGYEFINPNNINIDQNIGLNSIKVIFRKLTKLID